MMDSREGRIPTCLVVVEFGAVLREVDHQRLQRLARAADASVVHVRTDRAPAPGRPDPNRAFEFSGFQDGLDAALAGTSGGHDADTLRLVFVNDTLFRAHLPGYGSALVAALLALRPPGRAGGACVGIGGRVPGSLVVDGRAMSRYVSTWAFGVCAPRGVLRRLRFFDEGTSRDAFADSIWPGLPASYRNSIDSWLEPVHYLKGWYQAIPGRPLDEATRQRKRLSIYLEHTLALRVERAGVVLLDIGAIVPSAPARGAWAAWKLADRIYGNMKKLLHRAQVTLGPR